MGKNWDPDKPYRWPAPVFVDTGEGCVQEEVEHCKSFSDFGEKCPTCGGEMFWSREETGRDRLGPIISQVGRCKKRFK